MIPTSIALSDYAQGKVAVLGDRVFWTMPVISEKGAERTAAFVLFVSSN
jgi:hypothetical protein